MIKEKTIIIFEFLKKSQYLKKKIRALNWIKKGKN
jgi:hypothetical protein